MALFVFLIRLFYRQMPNGLQALWRFVVQRLLGSSSFGR